MASDKKTYSAAVELRLEDIEADSFDDAVRIYRERLMKMVNSARGFVSIVGPDGSGIGEVIPKRSMN